MEIDQEFGATSEIGKVETWNETELLLGIWFGFLASLRVDSTYMPLEGILSIYRLSLFTLLRTRFLVNSLVAYRHQSELFFRKRSSITGGLATTGRNGSLTDAIAISRRWVPLLNCLWTIILISWRVLKLHNFVSLRVSLVLWNVDKLTDESSRGVAWDRCREQELIQFHCCLAIYNYNIRWRI